MKKPDVFWPLIVAAVVSTSLVAVSGRRGRTMDAEELRGPALASIAELEASEYFDLNGAIDPRREILTLSLAGGRYVSIFPDGSVELPADLPVDDTAWRFWLALGNTWPDFREQMCGADWEPRR